MGIRAIPDLLFHLPLRYQDRTKVTPIGALVHGVDVVVIGQIEAADIRLGRRRSLVARISDGTGALTLRFFYFNQSQQKAFKRDLWIRCYGEARRGAAGLEMVHPEYRITVDRPEQVTEQSLTPVYPATEGVGPNIVRRLVTQALEIALPSLPELLPAKVRDELGLPLIGDALRAVHQPAPGADTETLKAGADPCQQRLALEELTAHHLALYQLRQQRIARSAPVMSAKSRSWKKLLPLLGFALTAAQTRVINELDSDLAKSSPALRMVQGDVGSGKTVVAAAAALQAIDSGYQVALMAPTELLAEQHRKNFEVWFSQLGINTQWLTGKLPAAERRAALSAIADGEAKLVIGTHALFQEQVEFHSLGLIIVDEQHRFGVDQRLALRAKGSGGDWVPHQVIMSATPIPRSLAMVLYADLDVSSIDELPPGRLPVNTVVLAESRRDEIAERIYHVCRGGQQAYWVCPLIEESDNLQAQAAQDTWQHLQETLPGLRIALVHGRLKSKEKDSIMQAFRRGETDLLVATTVIEVGVDVPNANLMVIENAERLGLAQLHQLRGRVGRGGDQATCVLLYKPPLGRLARDRLGLLRDSNDGFEIAQRDLEHRGPGEMLGTRQTGLQQLRIADLARDVDLFPRVEQLATLLRNDHPEVIQPLIDRWLKHKDIYANV